MEMRELNIRRPVLGIPLKDNYFPIKEIFLLFFDKITILRSNSLYAEI